LKSGVHATLAGVVTALAIPMEGRSEQDQSPLRRLEHSLHTWVAFLVLPVFAFANAGVQLTSLSLSDLTATIPLGVALGLFFGNQIAIFLVTFVAVKCRLANLPDNLGWMQVYGAGCLAGIGFTMSLFIGTLAFDSAELINQVRLGVLMGSFASAILGYLVLRLSCSEPVATAKLAPASAG
jgi:NhaA family Na+:H+ antiporter